MWRVTLHRNGHEWHSWHATESEARRAARDQRARKLGRVTITKES